jgi:signal transduction histidine kinase/ligand-binding sensor domain-containing protein
MSAWFSVLALLALFLTRSTQAQVEKTAPVLPAPISEPYLNESWGERDGLPGGPVQALWESNDGLLWVGSQYGLRIFDGKTFRIPEELADLKDESIEDIFTDGSGLLWMQGRKAIFSIQLRSDGVYEKSRFEGSNLAKDGLGWVWFKTGSEIRGRRGTMEASFPSEPASKSKSVGLKLDLWGGREGGVYRVDDQGTLWRGTPQGWTQIPGPLASGERVYRCGMFEDRQQRIWLSILTESKQLKLFTRTDGIWQRQPDNEASLFRSERCYHDTSRGAFLMGSDQGLIYHIQHEGKDRRIYKAFEYSEPIQAIHEDHLGNWWVGGKVPGLRLICRDPIRLLTLKGTPGAVPMDSRGGQTVEVIGRREMFVVLSAVSDDHGGFWVAAGSHGLMIRHGDELKAVTNASPQLPVDGYVSSLAVSPRGLVVGGRGLLLILDRDGRAVPTQDYSGTTKGRRVISLAVDELGGIWAGLDIGNIVHIPAETSALRVIPTEGPVFDLATQKDRVWVIDGKILRCWSKNRWENISEELNRVNSPQSLFVDRQDRLLVVGGSQVAIQNGQAVAILGSQQGVFPRLNSKWFQDQQSNLWLATDEGCLEVNPTWLNEYFANKRGHPESKVDAEVIRRVVHFSNFSDIRLTSKRSGKPCVLPSGEVALPSNKGVAVFRLDAEENKAWQPRVGIGQIYTGANGYFNGVVSMNPLVIPGGVDILLGFRRNLDATLRPPLIRCSLAQESIDWRYSRDGEPIQMANPASTLSPRNIQIKLDGGAWSDLVLRVQTKQFGGDWKDAPSISVKLDQYQQLVKRWRNIFIAAVLSLVGVAFWHFYRSTLQKRQLRIRTLEGIQEDRLRIGRSLHDDLGNRLSEIQLLAEQVKNASGLEFTTLGMVDRIHGRSVQAVESLDKMVWLLRDVSESAEDVAKHLELLAKSYLDVCSVGLDFKMLSGHEHEISGWVRQLLIAATQELTRNAVKHGRATELEMHLRVSDDSVSFRVEDNGCGFDLQTALLSGRGLSSILNRAKDFGGTTSVLSRPGCSVILIQVPRLVV